MFIIDWTANGIKVQCDGIPLTLPTAAYIPLWTYYGVKKIVKSSYTIRITATYDGLTYVLGTNDGFHDPRPEAIEHALTEAKPEET